MCIHKLIILVAVANASTNATKRIAELIEPEKKELTFANIYLYETSNRKKEIFEKTKTYFILFL